VVQHDASRVDPAGHLGLADALVDVLDVEEAVKITQFKCEPPPSSLT
jgi:hypothetical protein